LQSLGLYTPGHGNKKNIIKILKELHNAQLFLPIVFLCDYAAPYHITIFPAFYSVDRRATISPVLAKNFYSRGQRDFMVFKADNVTHFTFYLIDSSDLPSIYALAKDMVVSFPQIKWLALRFEHRCDIVSFLLTIDDNNRNLI
jgi:hypothetical protein